MFAQFDYEFFTVASVLDAHVNPHLLPSLKFSSITTSSLEVQPGALFVPLIDKRDGHAFIPDALHRGATAFLAKKNHPLLRNLSAEERSRAILVNDPQQALAALAAFHRDRFTPLVIGVTGSNGKTTTKEMLVQIFRSCLGRGALGTEKNYNNHIGVPFTLFGIKSHTRVAIIEMGMNHAGEISLLSRIARPRHAIISSIGHAHIEFLGSRQNIARAKAEILDGMQRQGGFLYVPADVAEASILAQKARSAKAIMRKISPQDNPVFRLVAADSRGYLLRFGKQQVRFRHANFAWLSNLALAATAANDAGLSIEEIATAVSKFRPPQGRMQVHRRYFTVIDDGYNANPDSAVASIKAAMQMAAGRPVVCVFADFKELGRFSKSLHQFTGSEAARAGVHAFYGVGEEMRHAVVAFQKIKKSGKSFHFARNEVDLLLNAIRQEKKGSVILVKGSRSMKMEEIVQELLRQE